MAALFLGGVPVRSDVDRLIEGLEYEPGTLIAHNEIAALIGVAKGTNRYRTVVGAWKRRMLSERNVDIQVERGVGYRVLLEPERVAHGVKGYRAALKAGGKAVGRVARADPERLNGTQQRQRDYMIKQGAALIHEGRAATREVARIGRYEGNPRPRE